MERYRIILAGIFTASNSGHNKKAGLLSQTGLLFIPFLNIEKIFNDLP
jgi:hypothetical protein